MYTTYKLTVAAAKMFYRNKQALFFTLFFPFFIMLIFGYIGFDKPAKIDVGLVTHSPTAATSQIIENLKTFPTFTIHEGTLSEEQSELNEGNRSIVLDVPDNIHSSPITAYINEGKSGEAQAVTSILEQFAATGALRAANVHPLFTVEPQVINSHNLRYIEFLLPGLIALSIMQMAVFSVAFVFVQYKEKGILKRLLATPMRPWQFLTSNIIVRLLVSVVQTAIFIGLALALFKVTILGSPLLLALCVLLGAVMFLGLGFTVSGLAKTVDAVPVFANLIVFPMLFLGGTFFPVSSMPQWLQYIAKVLPLTFFSGALRDIMTKGVGFIDIGYDILGMLVWCAVLVFTATLTFSFQEKESA